MAPREWFLLGLRLLAITLGVLVVMQTASIVVFLAENEGLKDSRWLWVVLAHAGVAVTLFLAAPWIAKRLHPGAASVDLDAVFGPTGVPVSSGGATPADAFVVGRRLLGLYVLNSAIDPLVRVADLFSRLGMDDDRWMPLRSTTFYNALGHVLLAVVLLVGPRNIGRGVAKGVRALRLPSAAATGGESGGGADGPS